MSQTLASSFKAVLSLLSIRLSYRFSQFLCWLFSDKYAPFPALFYAQELPSKDASPKLSDLPIR